MKLRLISLVVLALPSTVLGKAVEIAINSSIEIGLLSVETKERVYDPESAGQKISQLDWKVDNAPIIKANIEFDLNRQISIGAKGWFTLASRDGQMDDYDWLNHFESKWSDHSSHPDTKLQYANEIDVNTTFWIMNENKYRFGAVVGYQKTRYSWDADGGDYYYDNGTNIGSFRDGVKVITYKQKFNTPYIGISGHYQFDRIELDAMLKYSRWVKSSDVDNHILAETIFNSKVNHQHFYSISMAASYYIQPNIKFLAGSRISKFKNKIGEMEMFDFADNEGGSINDAAGIENMSYDFSIGFNYSF